MGIKVLVIEEPEDTFVDELLFRNVSNDYLFERTFYEMRIVTDDLKGMLYRRLWETVYLRMDENSGFVSTRDNDENFITLKISLSEALSFIKQATPPRLVKYINESTQSLHDICEVLKEFLINDKGVCCDYLGMFTKHIHFCEFETIWNENTEKVDYLFELNESCVTCSIVTSNTPLNDFMDFDYKIYHDVSTQLLCCCYDSMASLLTLFRLYLHDDYKIINVKVIDNKIYFMMYINIDQHCETDIRHLKTSIRSSYLKLLKQ